MIRHSSSLFLSLLFHLLLAFIIFLGYKAVIHVQKNDKQEKRLKIQLCSIAPTQPAEVPVKKTQDKPKPKIKPTPKPKIIKKIKPKPVITKKQIPKKTIFIKNTPKKIKAKVIEEAILKKIDINKNSKKKEEEVAQHENAKKVSQPKESVQNKELALEKNYINEHILKIKDLLTNNLYYPRSARKRGITGDVIVKFKLSTSAQAYSISIISSNSEILSRAAIKTIEDLSGEFPKPKEELTLHVPISYTLSR